MPFGAVRGGGNLAKDSEFAVIKFRCHTEINF